MAVHQRLCLVDVVLADGLVDAPVQVGGRRADCGRLRARPCRAGARSRGPRPSPQARRRSGCPTPTRRRGGSGCRGRGTPAGRRWTRRGWPPPRRWRPCDRRWRAWRKARGADLEHPARLVDLVARQAVQCGEEPERLAAERWRAVGDVGARAVPRLHDPHGRQRPQACADGGAADAELDREIPLSGKPVARPQLALAISSLTYVITCSVLSLPSLAMSVSAAGSSRRAVYSESRGESLGTPTGQSTCRIAGMPGYRRRTPSLSSNIPLTARIRGGIHSWSQKWSDQTSHLRKAKP